MGRTIITTCGTSLLTSSCWKEPFRRGKKLLSETADRKEFRTRQQKWEDAISEALTDDPTGASLAKNFDECAWSAERLRDLPAELASLYGIEHYLKQKHNVAPLSSEDHLILVHADNDDATFCASTLHQIFKNSESRLLSTSLEPLWKANGFCPGSATFQDNYNLFWNAIRDRIGGVDELYFNLTGGYKSMIMFFSCMAYSKGHPDSSVFYLNEESGVDILVSGFNSDAPMGQYQFRPVVSDVMNIQTNEIRGGIIYNVN